ncbi:MAG TPA: glycoside hydrolase 100 family protein [Steroidobacteraceae bacterium]|nr:glycoside hydrolase 100 family protein [Steroidobacteraceae bacterium]
MRRRGGGRSRGADAQPQALLAAARVHAIELLRRNTGPAGVLAASPSARARKRGYSAIFGRDAAICALGMALSGDHELRRKAALGLTTLAEHQAPNGQIPKFVDVGRREADFWYLGCIDATLWWLIGIALLDAWQLPRGLARTHARAVSRALSWLLAQEHQRFFLLQQNEASDWADIMPRSGFVLYTNTLWYYVKRLYGIAHAAATRTNFNGLFHPFTERLAEYRRGRLLAHYALRKARRRALYLSFVNFSFFGDEGDVFGNLLAILLGLADEQARERTLRALLAARVHEPYPVRVVVRPIARHDSLWRSYMSRHRQNLAWQYHNGGIWPMVGGFWVAALAACGRRELAQAQLLPLARACALGNWRFTEWLHGRTLTMRGMPGQSWNAAAYLLAAHCVSGAAQPFAHPAKRDRLHT